MPWRWVTCWPTTPIQAASSWVSTLTGLARRSAWRGAGKRVGTAHSTAGPTHFANSCLGTYDTTHPLMQNISAGSLCAFFRHTLALSAGAVSVAMYQDNEQLVAYKTNNGQRA